MEYKKKREDRISWAVITLIVFVGMPLFYYGLTVVWPSRDSIVEDVKAEETYADDANVEVVERPLDSYENIALPEVSTPETRELQSRFVNSILSGDFEGKRFWMPNRGWADTELGRFVISELEKRGAIYTSEDEDFYVSIDFDPATGGYKQVMLPDGTLKEYDRVWLRIDFYCGQKCHPAQVDNTMINRDLSITLGTSVDFTVYDYAERLGDNFRSGFEESVRKLFPLISQSIP